MRGIFNIMCGGLNNMRCNFLIMPSGFIIMRSRSCKWCSILIIAVVHLLSFSFMYSMFYIIRSTQLHPHFTPRKYWLITQEAVAPSRHDWKIVDWDVKPQHKQTNNCTLTLNIYKHTTSSSVHCSFFVMRGTSNIMCGGLNNMRGSFLIMRSGFVIICSRSCKWCSSLICTCCAFVKCRASFSFM